MISCAAVLEHLAGRWLGATVVALAVAGCAKPPPPPKPPPPTVVQLLVQASDAVNPDLRGRASPLVVRVYELKAPAAFDSADFFSLWDREREALGPDLVAREELQMLPGGSRKLERETQPETKYLAVAAAYRDLERARWRAVVAVVPRQTQQLQVRLEARSVAVTRP